jgi:hypothetical protein
MEGGRERDNICMYMSRVHYTGMEMKRNVRIQISSLANARRSQFAIVSINLWSF